MAIAVQSSNYRNSAFATAQARHLRPAGARPSVTPRAVSAPRSLASAKPANFRLRRLGVAAVLALAITAAGQLPALIGGAAASDAKVNPGAFHYVSVSAGDTLWSLAQRYAPGTDPNSWIEDVTTMNNLGSVGVVAGERIAIPNN